jgi:hypothetical protein
MGRKGSGAKNGGASPSPKQTAEGLSDDQVYSLTEQHRKDYEIALAAKKSADKRLKDIGKIIKADLGKHGMAQIKALIEGASPEGTAAIKARIERDAQVLRWLGEPIGTQSEMFPTDRTPLAERAFAEGKRQGLAGTRNENPHHQSTEAYHKHNEGYDAGQATLASGFKPLDNTPKGSTPASDWQTRTREQNREVENAIKTGTVERLGNKAPTHQVSA